MNKADVGAALAAALSVLASVAVLAREYASKALEYMRVSFVALISSRAVWAAVLLTSLGGFWAGHIVGATGKRALRAEVARLDTRAKISAAAATTATARATKAEARVADLAGTVEAMQAEIAALKARKTPASAPVAPAVKRPVAKTLPNKPAAGDPARARWTPWG